MTKEKWITILFIVNIAFFSIRNLYIALRIRKANSNSYLGRIRDGYLRRHPNRDLNSLEESYFTLAAVLFLGALGLLIFGFTAVP